MAEHDTKDPSGELVLAIAGAGGGNSDHLGGGGSWARQSTADVSTLMFGSDLVLGSSYNPEIPQVVLTFQVIANSAP